MTDTPDLRTRLTELRTNALQQLIAALPIIDSGLLRLAADTGAVQGALEPPTGSPEKPVPGDHAVGQDDNRSVQIVVYSADRRAAAATLSPVAAIRLNNRMISAAERRL